VQTESLLKQRAFMRFWCGRLVGTAANQMLMVSVGWQMYELTGSAWDLGLVGLLQFLPALLLTLVAGHVTDRHDRTRILSICMVTQGVIALLLMAAAYEHWASRGLLLILSIGLGSAKAFQMPAQFAIIPMLVPVRMLPRAMAFSAAGMQGAIIGGPALGGFIYVAGASVVYAVCAALFAAACVLYLRIGLPHTPPAREPVTMENVLAGVKFIWQRPVMLGAISLDLFAVLLGGATALLPIFAKDILQTGPWGLGLLRAAPAMGALMMSIALTRWPITRQVGKVLLCAIAVYGLSILAFGLSTSILLSMAALWVSGAADMVNVVVRQSLVQLQTPDAMRGRVSAVNSVFIGGSNQLGEFESGATAALWGPVGSVVVGGLGTLTVALLWFKLFPALAQRDRFLEDQAPSR
jgi:MFS family permease